MSNETNNTKSLALAKEREAFEAWYCNRYGIDTDISKLRNENNYGNHRLLINAQWDGWQGKAGLL